MKRVDDVIITVECECGHKTKITYTNEEWLNGIYHTVLLTHPYEGRDVAISGTCKFCHKTKDISLMY